MSLRFGSVVLDDPVVLAPMSGVTDAPFRRLAGRLGAGLVFSEMVAAKAVAQAHRGTLGMLDGDGSPFAVQLVGGDPATMAEAARVGEDKGAVVIDINMGCPVRKVVGGHAGSALMRDEALAGRIVAAVARAVRVPVTVKMRIGWDGDNRNAPSLARIAEDCGARMVTVHGRTRAQLYGGKADWGFIREVKRAVSIPVLGNGDVFSVDDAARLLAESGADGVMIARGALGRPWLPGQVAHFLRTGERRPDPSLREQRDMVLEHLEAAMARQGHRAGLRAMRKHIAWYVAPLAGAQALRRRINAVEDPDAARRLIRDFYAAEPERIAA